MNGVRNCYFPVGDAVYIYFLSINYTESLAPCGYGSIQIRVPTDPYQWGETCLYYDPIKTTWIGMWKFTNAGGCMNWFDIFNVTCID